VSGLDALGLIWFLAARRLAFFLLPCVEPQDVGTTLYPVAGEILTVALAEAGVQSAGGIRVAITLAHSGIDARCQCIGAGTLVE
jgi:hypothetical protein